jgi:leucyl-tRNA---protein transferase
LIQTHLPRKLSGQRYDQYLAAGWFRGSVMLYKMDLLIMDRALWSVVNIRLRLADFELRKSQRKCVRKVEATFRVVVQPARIDFRRESLYHQHKKRFKGFVHNTLSEYLHAGFNRTVFNTMEVGVYDGQKLIAVSFFDLGEQAMASLLALYDDAYAGYSLGRYTMLKEVEFGQNQGYKWYYPGYVLDRPSLFDYKTELGAMQHYTANRRWGAYANYRSETSPARSLRERTERLCAALGGAGIPYTERFYPFFSMAYLGIWSHAFLPLPLVVELGIDVDGMLVMGIEPVNQTLILGHMHPCPNEHQFLNREHAAEYDDPSAYLTHLMEFVPLNERFDHPDELIEYLLIWGQTHALFSPIPTE